jgi:hypothetical protein
MTDAAPTWLNGSYKEACQMVAERALYARMAGPIVKKADIDWQGLLGQAGDIGKNILSSPEAQGALLGAGAGGLGGALLSENKLQGLLTGGLLGGTLGGVGGHFFRGPGSTGSAADQRAQEEALDKSQNARAALGVLGADENAINAATRHSDSDTAARIHQLVPGVGEQAGNIPAAVLEAGRQGRGGDVLKQMDILGLKNVIPFSGHFSPGTAAAAAMANIGTRWGLPALRELAEGPSRGQVVGRAKMWNRVKNLTGAMSRIPGADWLQNYSQEKINRLADLAGHYGYFHTDPKFQTWAQEAPKPPRAPRGQPQPPTPKHWTRELKGLAGRPLARGDPIPELPSGGHLNIRENVASRLAQLEGIEAGAVPRGRFSKITGGALPALATLAPLLLQEWIGSGYRSGTQPSMDLADALQVLRK